MSEINNNQSDESDSEDDIPIAILVKRSIDSNKEANQKLKKSKTQETKSSKGKKEDNDKSSKKEKSNNNSSNSNGKSSSSSSFSRSQPRSTGSSKYAEFYENTKKGKIIQSLIIRWWYAIDWPKEEDIGEPPLGYEPLDGFTGVFVSTKMESLGQILDLRNKDTCPSLVNLIKKPASELKELCINAIQNQMISLKEAEGEVRLIHTLKAELADIKNIDPDKAENEAKKFNLSIK